MKNFRSPAEEIHVHVVSKVSTGADINKDIIFLVVSTYRDPFPGWIHNLQGPLGLFVGAGKGVIRSMYMDSHSYANLIPVDCTVSYILATCWYYLNNKYVH